MGEYVCMNSVKFYAIYLYFKSSWLYISFRLWNLPLSFFRHPSPLLDYLIAQKLLLWFPFSAWLLLQFTCILLNFCIMIYLNHLIIFSFFTFFPQFGLIVTCCTIFIRYTIHFLFTLYCSFDFFSDIAHSLLFLYYLSPYLQH